MSEFINKKIEISLKDTLLLSSVYYSIYCTQQLQSQSKIFENRISLMLKDNSKLQKKMEEISLINEELLERFSKFQENSDRLIVSSSKHIDQALSPDVLAVQNEMVQFYIKTAGVCLLVLAATGFILLRYPYEFIKFQKYATFFTLLFSPKQYLFVSKTGGIPVS